ncbi:MAG: hypothetical protein JNM79_12305 [Burkholderiales bacterium]|nr:hypothetical protein [Burkholderiales bacterium]
MERPSEDLRIPTPVSIGIAVVLCAIAALFWSAATKTEGYVFLGSVVLSLGFLLLAGVSLWFARNRFVCWAGIAIVVVIGSWKV